MSFSTNKSFEIGIWHLHEDQGMRIFCGWFSFWIPFFYSLNGYEYAVCFSRTLGWKLNINDWTYCYDYDFQSLKKLYKDVRRKR